MTRTQNIPKLIAADFPGRDALIDRTYRQRSSFRDLCGDYRRCAAALERWRRSDDAASPAREREYAELLQQLAGEISSWLEAVETGSTPSRQGGPR
jgi:hypothetical protein